MTRIINNLVRSADIAINQACYQLENHRPEIARDKMEIAEKFLKILKVISCNHNASSTEVMYSYRLVQKKYKAFRQVTKKCSLCNMIFYQKKYLNLKRKKIVR